LIGSKVAKRYAKALFGLGQEDGQYDKYGQDLSEFVAFCAQNDEFRQVISNPIFPVDDRKKILDIVLEKSDFSGMVKSFLRLLLDKNRIGVIEAISNQYQVLTDEVSDIARAEITTARPLKAESLERLEKALEALTSKQIKSEVKENRDLVGGIVVRIGDMVFDGSIKAQLEGLKESF
jgi:F-type H+-transporting ATPase subunit delta